MISLLPIFHRQLELMKKFEAIEADNGLLECQGIITHFTDPAAQAKLRRIAWSITEEVTEALDLHFCGARKPILEEISDAFHYLVELLVLSGAQIPVQDLEDAFSDTVTLTPAEAWMQFLIQLGRAINLLKNRPHKQSSKFKPVHRERFLGRLASAFFAFTYACQASGITAEELAGAYTEKAAINDQRIDASKSWGELEG